LSGTITVSKTHTSFELRERMPTMGRQEIQEFVPTFHDGMYALVLTKLVKKQVVATSSHLLKQHCYVTQLYTVVARHL
jgi:hypothetical protein